MEQHWFKIGDAARIVGISPKELRYWETFFTSLKTRRSEGNLRYYHRDDLPKLVAMHEYIMNGMTIPQAAFKAGEIINPAPVALPTFEGNSPIINTEDLDQEIKKDQSDRAFRIQSAKATIQDLIRKLNRDVIHS